MRKIICSIVLFCFVLTFAACSAQSNNEREMSKAWEAAYNAQVLGPNVVNLGEQGVLRLPTDLMFVPKAQANQLMKAMGNGNDPNMLGLVCSESEDEEWFIIIDYIASGYIEDDDAKSWDVDDLYNSVIEGTNQGNIERKKKGIPELEILGWVQKPQYDVTNKQLIWSIYSRDKGDVNAKPENQTINYNTYALGREGYLQLMLVTDMANVEKEKPIMAQVLAGTEFIQGKRYEDFNSSTDKVAEYGLAALIAGAAAKKLGFFAILAAFGVKFAKVIGIVVVAAGALFVKIWKNKKKEKEDTTYPPEG